MAVAIRLMIALTVSAMAMARSGTTALAPVFESSLKIDRGIPGWMGHANLERGGLDTLDDWARRSWARALCEADPGRDRNPACNTGRPGPVKITADDPGARISGLDFYDISLADGFDLTRRLEHQQK